MQQQFLQVNPRGVPLVIVRNARARRYILRVLRDGSARVTIPRGGSAEHATDFVARHQAWIERQVEKMRAKERLRPPGGLGRKSFSGETTQR